MADQKDVARVCANLREFADDIDSEAALLLESQAARIAAQAARVAELEAALRPFADVWDAVASRYTKVSSDWHERMPPSWPMQRELTVGNFRDARRALASPRGGT